MRQAEWFEMMESAGYALVGTGLWLIFLLCLGTYLLDGMEGVVEGFNPFALATYWKLVALVPGLVVLLWARRLQNRFGR